MTAQVFMLPDLGEGLTEAQILTWKVRTGDSVSIDQIIVEVETAKASVEVPSPFAGVVAELHGEEGTALTVGEPLITIGGGATAEHLAGHEQYRDEEQAGSGNVLIGYGTGHRPSRRRRRPRVVALPSSPSEPRPLDRPSLAPRVLSPIVRALASSHGLALDQIPASGDHGVITRADVERALATRTSASSAPPLADDDRVTRIPLTGSRKVLADKFLRSRTEIPEATVWVDVDATALLRARRDLDASIDGVKVTLLSVLAKLTTLALAQFPALNSTVDTAAGEILRHADVHLGIAAQTPRGLMVPVIAHADEKNLNELARCLGQTTELAREGSLPRAQLSGGTFTLNNYGVFGVDGSAAIINHPEAAILGIGRIIDRPWVLDGALAVRKVAQISLSFDHRVCDGGTAGGFLRTVADYVDNPVLALGGVR